MVVFLFNHENVVGSQKNKDPRPQIFKMKQERICQGPVVKSIVSLTSSLVVKMLTVLVSKISNSQVFLLKECE